MCGVTAVAAGAVGLSTLLNMQGQQIQAQQAQQQGAFQNQVANYNADLALQEASIVRKQAVSARLQRREQAEAFKGTQKAAAAASGVDIGSGSALAARLSTDFVTGQEDEMIATNFERRAQALEAQAGLLQQQGAFAQEVGAFNQQQAGMAQFGTLLGGVGGVIGTGVADKWFTPESAANQGVPTNA